MRARVGGCESELLRKFDPFCENYPKKTAKQQALTAWKKIKPDTELTEDILLSLEKHKNSEQWTKDNGRYIPYPATWLNGKRWEDELTLLSVYDFNAERLNRTEEEWLEGFEHR